MPGLYRCADALLHMSRDEPSAIAYAEALATGLPIVAHNWEVTRWTLPDHDLLVDSTDQRTVTAALMRAIEDKSPRKVQARRQWIDQRFSWSRIGREYSSFLLQLCGAPAPANSAGEKHHDVGVVAIGRNEGRRLIRCLESVTGRAATVVYVDSASDDRSVESARGIGAEVLQLEESLPFTAALARNLGAQRLKEIAPNLKYVQFVDGDCEVRPEWMSRARTELESNETLGAVCGRRRERFPHRTIYNRLIDIEWNTPPGPAASVGGDAMFRLTAFDAVGGYDPSVMAGEEPQLCLRLRHSHWNILRIDAEMTLHDAAITRFSQWWRRHVRAGYGTLDVNRRFKVGGERIFGKMVRSATMWAIGWPTAVIAAGLIAWALRGKFAALISAAIVFAVLPLQIIRLSSLAFLRGTPPRIAVAFGATTMLSKWAWFHGQVKYYFDRARGRGLELIEYKRNSSEPARVIPVTISLSQKTS
jgi:glycosyltransferase involved in cell wall biosynthesis